MSENLQNPLSNGAPSQNPVNPVNPESPGNSGIIITPAAAPEQVTINTNLPKVEVTIPATEPNSATIVTTNPVTTQINTTTLETPTIQINPVSMPVVSTKIQTPSITTTETNTLLQKNWLGAVEAPKTEESAKVESIPGAVNFSSNPIETATIVESQNNNPINNGAFSTTNEVPSGWSWGLAFTYISVYSATRQWGMFVLSIITALFFPIWAIYIGLNGKKIVYNKLEGKTHEQKMAVIEALENTGKPFVVIFLIQICFLMLGIITRMF